MRVRICTSHGAADTGVVIGCIYLGSNLAQPPVTVVQAHLSSTYSATAYFTLILYCTHPSGCIRPFASPTPYSKRLLCFSPLHPVQSSLGLSYCTNRCAFYRFMTYDVFAFVLFWIVCLSIHHKITLGTDGWKLNLRWSTARVSNPPAQLGRLVCCRLHQRRMCPNNPSGAGKTMAPPLPHAASGACPAQHRPDG